jgi:hypothetical protein
MSWFPQKATYAVGRTPLTPLADAEPEHSVFLQPAELEHVRDAESSLMAGVRPGPWRPRIVRPTRVVYGRSDERLQTAGSGSGSAEKEFCEQVGLGNVWAVAGWNLDRFDPEPLACHPPLPVRPDRAIGCGDDVGGGNLVVE